MSLTTFKPTLKQKDVPVPSMGKGATIIVTEKTIADAMRLQDLFKLLDDLKIKTTQTLIAVMLICTMKKPDGSYLLPDNDVDTINLVAYQTSDAVNSALYDAYLELNPTIQKEPEETELDAKKNKS